MYNIDSLKIIYKKANVLWVTYAAWRGHVQLPVCKHGLVQQYAGRTWSVTVMANAGLTGNCRRCNVNGSPASVGDSGTRGINIWSALARWAFHFHRQHASQQLVRWCLRRAPVSTRVNPEALPTNRRTELFCNIRLLSALSPFHWLRNTWLWMTLNRHFALNSVLCRYVWSSEAWLSKLGYS